MSTVEVIENPRRKRRTYTAKQRAAGFGGRRSMRSRPRRRRGRRRNPALATLAANPRRRRRRSYRTARRRYRRRNPALLKGFGLGGFDFNAALWVGIGAFGSRAVPKLVQRFWPAMPTTGAMGYLTRIGGTMATGFAVKMLVRSPKAHQMIMAGGLGMIVLDLLREHVAPRLGLGGLGTDEGYVTADELVDIYGAEQPIAGYVDTEEMSRMSGYVDWMGAGG